MVNAFTFRDCIGNSIALCSMCWVVSGCHFVPFCTVNIWHHLLSYHLNLYNNEAVFISSLDRLQQILD